MFRKLNTIIACLNTEHSNYILELNEYLKKYDRNITTLATENKRIYVNNKWTGLYRPMICFDFNKKKDMHLCFFMTGNKDYHRYGDPRFYFFNSNDKLRIDNPIWVPTKYLVEIEFDKQIQKFV
ncbi:MAG: hypothetical protein LBF00_00825, partial [Mycoplasmataceae bacterium]|nr:hypothetical protein [Mycoplasmataceae bacterium]